jgi:hypothetical protein
MRATLMLVASAMPRAPGHVPYSWSSAALAALSCAASGMMARYYRCELTALSPPGRSSPDQEPDAKMINGFRAQ